MDGIVFNTGLKNALPSLSPVVAETEQVELGLQGSGAPESSQPPPSSAEIAGGEPMRETTPAQAVAFANTVAALFDTKLSFNYDERIDRVVVSIKEGSTDEVIRQFPPEEMIELAAKFRAHSRGLILNCQG